MNKQEAKQQLNNLQKEVDRLKEIINKSDDLFSITTYKEVCEKLGEKQITNCDFGNLPYCDVNKLVAFARIKQLERLYNENWEAKFNDKQYNYYHWFKKLNGSWRCYLAGCNCSDSGCCAGLFKNEKIAKYIGQTFLNEIYLPLLEE